MGERWTDRQTDREMERGKGKGAEERFGVARAPYLSHLWQAPGGSR